MAKKLDSYKGRLSPEQIVAGINAARRNARRLHEDSETMLHSGRLPTAVALAILSVEESGKVPILRGLALATTDEEASEIWRDYRTHTRKNVMWLLPQLAANGARKLEDFLPLFESSAEHPHILDQIKQISMYTDCLGKAHWSNPSEIVDSDLACALTRIAKSLLSDDDATTDEMQLWIKHMRPVKNGTPGERKEALKHWYEEMHELELVGSKVTLDEALNWLG